MRKLILFSLFVAIGFSATAQYTVIDAHAKSTVIGRKDGIPEIVKKITARSSNENEKVRAIFIWIASNIKYDVSAFMSGRTPASEPMGVIRNKSAVCQGYSNLFEAMCSAAGIQAHVVSGFSKGYGYENRKKLDNADHAWNAVKIDEEWQLLDVTWGAGHLNEKGHYVSAVQNKYFLSNPTYFITEHLPEDPAWQMLPCPISPKEFLTDSAEVRKLAQTKKSCYAFADTLNVFAQLKELEQKIATAKRMLRYFPDNIYTPVVLINQVAYYYSTSLNDDAVSIPDKMKMAYKSRKYYQMAFDEIKKPASENERELKRMVEQNLKNVKNFIEFYENQ